MRSNKVYKKDSKHHSDFKGVTKYRKQYKAYSVIEDENGNKNIEYKMFRNEIDAALSYNKAAIERKGLAARINTVPVPGLECVGNCEWELGSHYFTKEDLEPKE